MSLFTAEGLIRASNRWAVRGLVNETFVVWRAYERWLETQEHPFDRRPSTRDSGAGWLISQPALFGVQAPGMTCLSALRNGEPGTIPASNFPQWSPSYDLRVVDEDTGEERGVALRHAEGSDATPESVEKLGQGWVAEEALAIAVFSALKVETFLDGVSLAANHGGDSDSTAAIAGNLLGTMWDVEAIPTELAHGLEAGYLVREVAGDLARCFVDHDRPYDIERYPPN